jgi:hypothetical protein
MVDQANLKVSLWNILVILVIVVLFVPLLKMGTNKWLSGVPGFPTMVNAI